jgi:N-acetylglucosaminyldiphosphoundecaprenol N-acetyl-beta-D-mannosaminyltransferase
MSGAAPAPKQLLGVRIDPLRMPEVVSRCERAAAAHERLVVGVVNAAKIVAMQASADLRAAVLSADLVIPDGMAVVWASGLLGEALPERVTGIDLFEQLLAVAARRGLSVYFLGATDAVLEDLMAEMARRHPDLRVAGRCNGYFDDAEAGAVARAIDAVRPDFLFVGISTPKKERFLAEWAGRMQVGVCHGVGGAFDVLAGKVSRAPAWMQATGLEWLYRVIQEPRRMWKRYLVTNTRFASMLMREWLRRRPRARATPGARPR